MNLMVAVLERAAVVNVRLAHRATAREGDDAGRAAEALITVAVIGSANAILHVDVVASGDAVTEVEQAVGRIIQARFLSIGQHPDADAVAVRRRFLAARLEATGFAAVFDVHAEQDSPRFAAAAGAIPVTDTGEHDLIGGRAARFGSRDPVARIAEAVHDDAFVIYAVGEVGAEARAIERIEVTGMEVTFQTALFVPDMRPATMDARIAQDIVEGHHAIGVTH